MSQDKIYTPASTDITLRWKKLYGYVPASEQEFYKNKWATWKAILNAGIDDLEPVTPKKEGLRFTAALHQLRASK
jgi:hypothetical protein